MVKKKIEQDVEIHVFIEKGCINLVKNRFGNMQIPDTGVVIFKADTFLSKTAYKSDYPQHKKDIEYLDPSRNVTQACNSSYACSLLCVPLKRKTSRVSGV